MLKLQHRKPITQSKEKANHLTPFVMRLINKIQAFFEKQAFGVCSWWGGKLGIKTSRIRLFFIYLSFITLGSPLVIYLVMAFVLEHKDFFKAKKRRTTIWDL